MLMDPFTSATIVLLPLETKQLSQATFGFTPALVAFSNHSSQTDLSFWRIDEAYADKLCVFSGRASAAAKPSILATCCGWLVGG